jgi:hypothetical protein
VTCGLLTFNKLKKVMQITRKICKNNLNKDNQKYAGTVVSKETGWFQVCLKRREMATHLTSSIN